MLPVGIVVLVSTLLTFLVAGQTTGLIYLKLFLGIGLVGGYFATNKKSAQKMLGNRSTALLVLSAITAVVFVGVLAAINFISAKNPKEYDVTREGIYTLADQTTKTLQGLKEEVTAYAFYRSDEPQYGGAKDTLDRYKAFSNGKLVVEMVDPMQHPDMVEQFQIREGSSRVVFKAKGAHEARPKDLTEQELTNALVKVTASAQKKVYLLTGHGEPEVTDTTGKGASEIVAMLKNEGYVVDTFSFTGSIAGGNTLDLNAPAPKGEVSVPADAQVVIAMAGKTPLAQPEIDALLKFLDRGGRVIATLETGKDSGLEKLALAWHIEAHNDIVVDTATRALNLPPTIGLVQAYDEHPITKDFRQPLILPGARSLAIKDGGVAGVTAKLLARTGKTAWGETEYPSQASAKGPQTVSRDEGKDNLGPVALVAVADKKATVADKISDDGRLIVFGDTELVTNAYKEFEANGDFFVNSVNYLSDEEGKISIRPKTRGATRLFLTETQSDIIKFFSIDILPVAIFAIGVAIRAVRRRK